MSMKKKDLYFSTLDSRLLTLDFRLLKKLTADI
jgi:hypothetical protein